MLNPDRPVTNPLLTVGGIISTYSFLSKDAPFYRPGYSIGVSFLAFSAAMSILYFFAVWHDNKKRDRAIAEGRIDPSTITEEEEELLGDMSPTYRYAY